jgi:hypothetical protein
LQVRRPEPVKSLEQKSVFESVIKLDAPPPIDFSGATPAAKSTGER